AQAYNGATEAIMNEDVFNGSIRKFLKTLGVSAQREIEKAVRQALAEGRLKGNEKFPAKATVTLGGIAFSHEIKSEIEVEGRGARGGCVGSTRGPPVGLDRPGPLLDLALDELAEIFRRGAVLGHDHGAEPFEPLLHHRRFHRLDGGVVELLDDIGRHALWKEDRVPGVRLEVRRALLVTGRHVRQRVQALLGHGVDLRTPA